MVYNHLSQTKNQTIPPSLCLISLHLNCIYSSLVKKKIKRILFRCGVRYHYSHFEFLFVWLICCKPWSNLQLFIILPNSVMVNICLFDKVGVQCHYFDLDLLFISLIRGAVFCCLDSIY